MNTNATARNFAPSANTIHTPECLAGRRLQVANHGEISQNIGMQPASHLFVDISSHGFGHLAITAPVLNALADLVPGLHLTIRSGLPPAKLAQRIHTPYTLIAGSSDFGYVMHDATRIDLPASAAAYRDAHAQWSARLDAEAVLLRNLAPDAVLTNVSYLPLAGAAQAGIPAWSLCSLNWADLFQHYFGSEAWAGRIHTEMLDAYRSAQGFLRVTPGMAMDTLANLMPVGIIAAIGKCHRLGPPGQRHILVALGGITHCLPVENWPRLPETRWLVPAAWHCRHPDAVPLESLGLSFTDLLASVDAVITKPGYGTFTEAACNGTPVLYQRREDWPEQDCLIDWLRDHGRSLEISAGALAKGEVAQPLAALLAKTKGPPPAADGALAAARLIAG